MSYRIGTWIGHSLAWLLVVASGWSIVACHLWLRELDLPGPENMFTQLGLLYLVPFPLIVCAIVFEGWASLRTSEANPWPVLILVVTVLMSLVTIYFFASVHADNRSELLAVRSCFVGVGPSIRATSVLIFFGFYLYRLIRDVKQQSFTLSFGRFAVLGWMAYFSISRMYLPLQTIDRILYSLP